MPEQDASLDAACRSLVRKLGQGFKIAMATLDLARRALDEALARVKSRRVFGRALAEFQLTQLFGGTGVVSGMAVERLYREIRALRIYEGTCEIQKLVIAGAVLQGAT